MSWGSMSKLYAGLNASPDREFVYTHPLDEEQREDIHDDDVAAIEPIATTTGVSPMRHRARRYAGVEGGGTSWVCAISEEDVITARAEFPTTTPEETLSAVREWLDAVAEEMPFDALGVATFGPLDLDPESPTYGFITHSPKPGWENVDVLGALWDGTVPCGFDTDVNAPAMAEFAAMRDEAEIIGAFAADRQGNARDDAGDWEEEDEEGEDGKKTGAAASVTNLVYVTVGTGVGVGIICGGKPVHGRDRFVSLARALCVAAHRR